MVIKRNANGVIINAELLQVDDIVQDRVLCPACHQKVFERWPLGWDAHAHHVCPGIRENNGIERKANFKNRFHYLFR